MPDISVPADSLQSRFKSWRFLLLFGFLLAIFLLSPLILRSRLLYAVLSLLFLNGLYVSLSAAGFAPRWRWFFIAIWFLGAVLMLWAQAAGDTGTGLVLFTASRATAFVLLVACVTGTMRYVLRSARITVDTIFAAIVAFQLTALAFAVLYHAIVAIEPESFAFSQGTPGDQNEGMLLQLIYFSFVTIATLGYGDIVPTMPLTQMIATVEATFGQFYIAVVIAWLVSVYAARHTAGLRQRQGGDG
jgi:hypothetical protein